MNRERIKELLPVFEAFANGEDIQFMPYQYNSDVEHTPDWSDLPKDQHVTMTFPCEDYDYRIKPKPREFWIEVNASNEILRSFMARPALYSDDVIKVREVLDEEM